MTSGQLTDGSGPAYDRWATDGFVVLPDFLPLPDVERARADLAEVYPELERFHAGELPDHSRDCYRGQREMPFASDELNLLTIHPRLVSLAEVLLGTKEIRLYAGEAWAKFAGCADYGQDLHRDLHSPLIPSNDVDQRQVEMFVFLTDVEEHDGPPAFVSRKHTAHLPMQRHAFGPAEHPELYELEVRATGRAGTVVAYSVETVHRATELRRSGTWRLSLHANYRAAEHEWTSRHAWGDRSFHDSWTRLVEGASYRQLLLFGFPPAGHRYWTQQTLAGMEARYAGADFSEWRKSVG